MSTIFPLLDDGVLTLGKYSGLFANLTEMAYDLLVAIIESVNSVRDFDFLAELQD